MSEGARKFDVIIIGGGVAGKTAAIYTSRAGLSTAVLTGMTMPGGALTNTNDIENFPGFVDGIPGTELMDTMQNQAERFGAEFIFDGAESVDLDGRVKEVQTEMGESLEAKAVILALGSLYREIGCEGEREFQGRGVSYCATCDGFFFKDKDLIVVGGGDTAMEEAIFLTKFATSVTIVHRRDEFRASAIMAERAAKNPKIKFELFKTVDRVYGEDGKVTGVILEDTRDGSTKQLACQGVFVAVGFDPSTLIVRGKVDLDDAGYIIVDGRSSKTSIPGVFAAGDATDPVYRQAIVAAGHGAKAGIDAGEYIENL